MARVILILVWITFASSLSAGIIGWSGKLTGTSIVNGAVITTEDDRYSYMVANPTTWKSEFFNYRWKNRVSLRFTDTTVASNYLAGNWTVSVPCSLEKWDETGASLGTTTFTLTLDVKPGQSAMSKDLDVYEINDTSAAGFKTKLTVGTVTFTGTASTVPVDVMLENEIETERYYYFSQASDVPTISCTTNSTDNTITFYWPHKDGAEEYELEWLHASIYGPGGGTVLSKLNPLKSERIQTGSLYYTIQNVFDTGYVYYRLRWIGRDTVGTELRNVESQWSSVTSSTRVLVNDFDRKRHWSYSESFSEHGKRAESLAFLDDIGRGRQMMGLVKTENKLLISEPYYDYEGRAVLQTMAAPDSGYSGKFGFKNAFTVNNATATALHPKDYDTDDLYTSCTPQMDIELSSVQGASRYYSSSNSLKDYGMNAYLPDAQKYPYVHLRFNNEGELASVSTPGKDHALGSGKETQIYQASVPQEKLFELFGNSVGYAKHYRSKYVSDANGQISGSYEDMSGKVIASFLAGGVPSNVDTISDYPANFDTLVIDMLQYDQFVTGNNSFELYNDIMVTEATSHEITYGVTPSVYEGLCDTINCHYNLTLEVIETNCPVPPLYTYTANISSSALTHTVTVNFPRIGKYKIKKTLTLNQDSLSAALQYFINNYDSCNPFIAPPDTGDYGCNDTCTGDCNPWSPANSTTCQDLYDHFISDLSPLGQYFENQQRFEELMSAASVTYSNINTYYQDSCGGTGSITDYASLESNWTDCIANYLVKIHPEYCHYEWCTIEDDTCNNGESSRMFDGRISQYNTYSAANTAFSLSANAGDEGQQVLDADPFFNCSRASAYYNMMKDSVDPTSNANAMWEKAVTIANCGTSPCDDEWGVFRLLYLGAKSRIIAKAKIDSSCGFLPDVQSPNHPLTMNGMHEEGSGDFVIWVQPPTILDTLTIQPDYSPSVCPEKQCTTIRICSYSYNLSDSLEIHVQYNGSGGNSYSYNIVDTSGLTQGYIAPRNLAKLMANCINAYQPSGLPGIYPTFSASVDSSALTAAVLVLCIHGPNDVDSGQVLFNVYGASDSTGCATGWSPFAFVYDPPDTSTCNDIQIHCFCSELQNYRDAWDATYINLNGDTVFIIDHNDYASELAYITAELNNTYGTSVSQSNVQDWLDNCDLYSEPVHDTVNDPALPLALDCTEEPDLCAQEAYTIIYQNAYDQWLEEKEQHIQDFIKNYTAACFDTSLFSQRFDVEMPTKEYHFTLYYYDQADNLVRTVSPKAVQKIALDTSNGGNLDQMYAWLAGTGATPYYPSHNYYYAAGTLPNGQTAVPQINLVTTYKYNTLNQPTETTHPDQTGQTKYYYDFINRLVASQNPKQAGYSPDRYSYTLFDSLGRITEIGELATDSVLTQTKSGNDSLWNLFLSYANAHYDVTQSFYDENAPVTYNTNGFNADSCYLRNRVATITYERIKDTYDSTYDAASYYQYDVHGNAERVLKDVTELTSLAQNLKQTRYEYELISGNVSKVIYQEGQVDQFIHTYDYDDDNRLTREYSSNGGLIYHNDQKQFYYLHGPAGRVETGQHKVQGQDLMYTIQGWLKGVNAAVLNQHNDAGKDGRQENICISTYSTTPQYISGTSNQNLHSRVASDAFGYMLSYYDSNTGGTHTAAEDYKPINTNGFSVLADINTQNLTSRNLYNGNIKQMSVALMKPNSNTGVDGNNIPYASQALSLLTWRYEYDQLHRLLNAAAYTGTTTTSYASLTNTNEYKNTFTYDPNGNIVSQLRNGNSANLNLDNLVYHYATNTSGGATNQLKFISTSEAAANNGTYSDDFDTISRPKNCTYDEIGNLKIDQRHFIKSISWNVYGKVTEVLKDRAVKFDDYNNNGSQDAGEPAVSLSDIEYRYNEAGQRIVKIVKPHDPVIQALVNQEDWIYTYYSHDADGNVMATYSRDYSAPAGPPWNITYQDEFYLKEHHIYASERVGIATYADEPVAVREYAYTGRGSNNELEGTPNGLSEFYLDTITEQRILGLRLYELSNHLGNVMVTVSDKKIPVFDSVTTCTTQDFTGVFTHYTADLHSTTDYSPFGAPLAGRTFSTNIYRYGFSSKEKVNEIYGEGDFYDFGARGYDSRICRWISADVYKVRGASNSTYSNCNNNPIIYNDPNGEWAEIKVTKFYNKGTQLVEKKWFNVFRKTAKKVIKIEMHNVKVYFHDDIKVMVTSPPVDVDDFTHSVEQTGLLTQDVKEKAAKLIQNEITRLMNGKREEGEKTVEVSLTFANNIEVIDKIDRTTYKAHGKKKDDLFVIVDNANDYELPDIVIDPVVKRRDGSPFVYESTHNSITVTNHTFIISANAGHVQEAYNEVKLGVNAEETTGDATHEFMHGLIGDSNHTTDGLLTEGKTRPATFANYWRIKNHRHFMIPQRSSETKKGKGGGFRRIKKESKNKQKTRAKFD